MTEEHDTTTVYVSDGEETTFAQIAMVSAKDPDVTVKEHPDGYLVNGKLFQPADGD